MSCNRCKKRSLTHIANAAFKDARTAKGWLHARNVPGLKGEKPIDVIARPDADHHKIVTELYVAAMQDETVLSRESVEERKSRFLKSVMGIFNCSQAEAGKWIARHEREIENDTAAGFLQRRLVNEHKTRF